MKYKVLKSAAHNFGHSFVSLMNWGGDDYVMSILARSAVETGEAVLSADLIAETAEPAGLLSDPVRTSIRNYRRWLPKFLESHGVSAGAVSRAKISVRFDLARRSTVRGGGSWEVPFECSVVFEDDRGVEHSGIVKDWWWVVDEKRN